MESRDSEDAIFGSYSRKVTTNITVLDEKYYPKDWDSAYQIAVEIATAKREQEEFDEETESAIDWINASNGGCIQGSGGDTTGAEVILRPGQDDLDIADLQHNRVSDE